MSTFLLYSLVSLNAIYFMCAGTKSPEDKSRNKIFLKISFSTLLFLITFRHYTVGVDTLVYIEAYFRTINNTLSYSDVTWLGNGYIYLSNIVGFFAKNNYVVMHFVVGFLSLYFLYKAILQNSKMPHYSLFLFISFGLYYQMFNQSRQLLAICVVLYSYKYLKSRSFFKYSLAILFAYLMHNSALLMLPIYFFANMNVNNKKNVSYIIIGIVIYIYSDFFIDIILLTSYGQIYANSGYFVANNSSLLNLFIRIIFLLSSLLFMKQTQVNNDDAKILYNMVIFCTFFQILATKVYILSRITTYFFVFYIFLIPEIICGIKNNNNKKIVKNFVTIFFILYYLLYYNHAAVSSGYDLFRFIWN